MSVPDHYADGSEVSVNPIAVSITFRRSLPHPAGSDSASEEQAEEIVTVRLPLIAAKAVGMSVLAGITEQERQSGQIIPVLEGLQEQIESRSREGEASDSPS